MDHLHMLAWSTTLITDRQFLEWATQHTYTFKSFCQHTLVTLPSNYHTLPASLPTTGNSCHVITCFFCFLLLQITIVPGQQRGTNGKGFQTTTSHSKLFFFFLITWLSLFILDSILWWQHTGTMKGNRAQRCSLFGSAGEFYLCWAGR